MSSYEKKIGKYFNHFIYYLLKICLKIGIQSFWWNLDEIGRNLDEIGRNLSEILVPGSNLQFRKFLGEKWKDLGEIGRTRLYS